ncbi:MAG: hypothetical protein QM645_11350 [Asticcacaulis sp.]
MHPVTVFYLDNTGKMTRDVIDGQPCIRLKIAWDKDCGEKRIAHPRKYTEVIGLIDTGAQGILCDNEVIKNIGAPYIHDVANRTSNGIEKTLSYCAQLHLPEYMLTKRVDIIGADLRRRGNPYDLLLGRNFLQFTSFRWDATSGIQDFSIHV